MPAASARFAGGLLFDIDGTLAHTDPFHLRAFNSMLAPFGISISEADYSSTVMGRTNAAIMADFFPDAPIAEHLARARLKEELFRDYVRADIHPLPGLMPLLDWAEEQEIPKAVVTNAPIENAMLILDGLGIRERFGAIVIGDELPHGKPHPLPYLTGASRLGVDPARSVAFEDSRSGITSARAAGAHVYGMRTSLDAESLMQAGAHATRDHFADLDLRQEILSLIVF